MRWCDWLPVIDCNAINYLYQFRKINDSNERFFLFYVHVLTISWNDTIMRSEIYLVTIDIGTDRRRSIAIGDHFLMVANGRSPDEPATALSSQLEVSATS